MVEPEEPSNSRERYRLLVESLKDYAIFMVDTDGRVADWNAGAQRVFGYREEEIVGRHFSVIFTPEDILRGVPERERRQATSEERGEDERWHARKDGTRFWASGFLRPVRDEGGNLHGFVKVVRDTTERKRAEDALRILAEASELLASPLDYRARLRDLTRLVVPDLADWCAVDVLGENGSLERLAVMHEDPEKVELVLKLQERYPDNPDALYGVPNVLRTGEPEMMSEVPEELLDEAARDAEHREILRELDLGSYMVVPMVARGPTLGTISFVSAKSRRRYDARDLAIAETLVRRAALAVDNARLYEEAQQEIVKRRRAEEALRESEERFRSAFESAPIGMALVRLEDGRWLEVNRPLCEIIGYPEHELLELTFQEVTHPDDLDAELRQVERMLRGEIHALQMEKRYIRKDGRVVWVLLSSSLVRDASGEPLYGIAQVQDITQRKQAEEALAQSESRLRMIVETEPECVKVLDMDGCLLEMNPAGLAMVEADSLEQVRGKPVYDVVVPEYRADYMALTERVLRGGSGTLEFESVGLKGTRCWLETHAVPLRDARGEITGLLGITRDITERKKAEQALIQSERLYRTVIEQATENIFLVDMESRRIVESNPAFRDALGYTQEELKRMTLYDVVAADRESVDRNMQRTLEKRRSFVDQRRYRRKDGTFLEVEVSASVILRDGRETLCVVAHDITERVRAQQLLEERLAILSRIASRLTLDLPMQDTLDAMAESIVNVSTAVACSVILVDEATGLVHIEGSHGLSEEFKAGIESVWREGAVRSPTIEAIRMRQPILASRMRQRMLENPLYAPVHRSVRDAAWDTVFIVPLVSRDKALGAINFSYLEGEQPGEDERIFLRAIADQAAVAVENARLYAEARGKVALEERQRLARELHDSVSQALYGIALGTKAARAALKHDSKGADDSLDYVLSSAEAGLAEMRALIFELRPESLQQEGLCAALEKQAAAVRARHRVGVKATLCEEPEASLETKEAIYRIAQEALHNTVKHAHARNVRMEMECASGKITLEISDDGVGFKVGDDFPGHLGLRSMRERASELGGTLQVDSAIGKGTLIRAQIPI